MLYSVLQSHHFFWAAPAPEVQGPGAHSGSNQIGLAPAPVKRRRLQAALAPQHWSYFSEQEISYVKNIMLSPVVRQEKILLI